MSDPRDAYRTREPNFFGRDKGELVQEVGGVMITLMSLCTVIDVDADVAGETELARVWDKIDVIRTKQQGKPVFRPKP